MWLTRFHHGPEFLCDDFRLQIILSSFLWVMNYFLKFFSHFAIFITHCVFCYTNVNEAIKRQTQCVDEQRIVYLFDVSHRDGVRLRRKSAQFCTKEWKIDGKTLMSRYFHSRFSKLFWQCSPAEKREEYSFSSRQYSETRDTCATFNVALLSSFILIFTKPKYNVKVIELWLS